MAAIAEPATDERLRLVDEFRPAWQGEGACRAHPEIDWFPERGQITEVAAAKAVCARCPVRQPCLDSALAQGIGFGVWGGLSAKERKRLRRRALVTVSG